MVFLKTEMLEALVDRGYLNSPEKHVGAGLPLLE
jgi:hypothetical protein